MAVTLLRSLIDALGDPHALDPGRSVSRLVLAVWLAHADGIKPPMDAESSRLLWEAAGVAPDPLSSTVLAFGLTAGGDHPLAGVLTASAEAIEPVVLTLAQLRRWPLPALPTASEVYVFENPSLVAEATSRDWSGPPIVCSSGLLTVAVSTLLRQLGARGAVLHQHADFDANGPGHYGVDDTARRYVTVAHDGNRLHQSARRGPDGMPLRGTVPPTLWDPALGDVVRSAGVVVYEEELRAQLLDEIERSGR